MARPPLNEKERERAPSRSLPSRNAATKGSEFVNFCRLSGAVPKQMPSPALAMLARPLPGQGEVFKSGAPLPNTSPCPGPGTGGRVSPRAAAKTGRHGEAFRRSLAGEGILRSHRTWDDNNSQTLRMTKVTSSYKTLQRHSEGVRDRRTCVFALRPSMQSFLSLRMDRAYRAALRAPGMHAVI